MKLYSMNISVIDASDARWFKYLSDKRIEKVNRIKPPLKKAQSIGAELLLRRAVYDITGINENVLWDTEKNGKPFLVKNSEIFFNLSHSGKWVVCAVNDAPVGVDIQCKRDFDMALTDRYFTEDEAEYTRKSDNQKDAFYTVWTKKESLLKAAGKGLTVPLKECPVLENSVFLDGILYKFKEYTVRDKDYKLFVCSASGE